MEGHAPVSPPYRPGDVLAGRYEIRWLLDQGGSSEVYLAADRALRRSVVIKAPRVGLLRDPRAVARFRHEAEGLARLAHPSLVTVHDIGLDPPYIVEEYVQGRSLAEVLLEGPMSPARTAEIGASAADALAAVHQAGMLHRDLKPANLMLTQDGGVKLLDLGIAWAAEWTPLSRTGDVVGTAAYVSPEQVSGRTLDPRSDVYSLGVVLYEMLAGSPPFSGTALELIEHHVHRPPRPLRSVHPDVPSRLAFIVDRCLSKDPGDRPAGARAVANELRTWSRGAPSSTDTLRLPTVPTERLRRPGRTGRRRRGRFVAVGAMLVLALVMIALPRAEAALRPPSQIRAHGACDGFLKYRATVTWRAPSRADGYVVFRRSVPGGRWEQVTTLNDPVATTFVDHGLGGGDEYAYQIRTTGGDRISKPSPAARAGTPFFCFG